MFFVTLCVYMIRNVVRVEKSEIISSSEIEFRVRIAKIEKNREKVNMQTKISKERETCGKSSNF